MRPRCAIAAAAVALAAVAVVAAQRYKGPVPPQPDLPYLIHGDQLIALDVTEAREETRKDWRVYVVPGASAQARTPLAGPLFLVQSERLAVERLALYPFEVKGGQREVAFNPKKPKESAKPARLNFTRLGENLFRIEVVDSLPEGQYGLSPDGSNRVFCFEVF